MEFANWVAGDSKSEPARIAETVLFSYPRSGSKWLRFILCNVAFPLIGGHVDGTVSYYFPRDEAGCLERSRIPRKFVATHQRPLFIDGMANNYIYLHRHVGDVLISNYHFHKQSIGYQGTLEEYIETTNYGEEWRMHIESARLWADRLFIISYDQLSDLSCIGILVQYLGLRVESANNAMQNSSFEKMVEADDGKRHHLRAGKSNQWRELPGSLREKLLEANKEELKWLKYD